MSPSDAQPPLSRRQARERERAANGGAQPVTPPPTVPSSAPASADSGRRRPGSHVAPSPAAPAQAPAGVPAQPPASATEIVPGTGGLTRRQMRQMRDAAGQGASPVPLQNPTPQSSDRTVQDVIGTVGSLPDQERPSSSPAPSGDAGTDAPADRAAQDSAAQPTPAQPTPVQSTPVVSLPVVPSPEPTPVAEDEPVTAQDDTREPTVLDQAAVDQATSADGSPDALEPLDEAAAHAEEPRRHRSTWAPQGDVDSRPEASPAADDPAVVAPEPTPAASRPGVFPLSLDADDDDTNEVPIQTPTTADDERATPTPPDAVPADGASADVTPAPAGSAFRRPVEPKPVTTAFEAPTGHWSTQAHDSHDAEVHDAETGTRRVAESRTNAIILPNSALADPTGALNATGEVILTGSIDLPASLSSTGSHRPIDGAEVDRLLEQHDEQPETDASPVRASRAVSSHTSTRQVVLAAAKPKESRTPLILGVTVGAVGVAAAAVIIVALVTTNFFGS